MDNRLSKIIIKNWQQIEYVEIDLSNRLTILTGSNGSGKTSILSILGKHANWHSQSLGMADPNNEFSQSIRSYLVSQDIV